ncbi:MAG: hypothetical protein WEK74_00030 [Hydrogenophaga sp.]
MARTATQSDTDKSFSVSRANIKAYKSRLLASAKKTQKVLAKLALSQSPASFLDKLKFAPIGCDPLNADRELNLIEQLTQAATYLASFDAAEFLFSRHPEARSLRLNLGTSRGFDIETNEDGGIDAEVFAAVDPKNNQKLAKDCKDLKAKSQAKHRYVIFRSPKIKAGPYHPPYASKTDGICV